MDKYYRKVPAAELEKFIRFRRDHPLESATINGIHWEYLSSWDSSKLPLVLMSGALGTAESAWRTLDLLEQSGRFQLVCPNYPAEVSTMTGLADGVVEILKTMGIGETFVVGGSYGGMLAQVFAHRHPAMVSKLVLSHTYPPVKSRASQLEPTVRLFKRLPMFLLKKMLRDRMTGILPPRPSPELLLIAAQIHETVDTRLTRLAAENTFLRMMDFDRQEFTASDLANLHGKTLIMLAEDDPTTPGPLRKALVDLYPGAKLHIFKGGGHATSILESIEYVRVMEEFLIGNHDEQMEGD